MDGRGVIEKAVAFGPDRSLVGVWTQPVAPVPEGERVAVIMINSGIIHHAGVWRLHVRTARALADIGIASLRFDLSGIGDSGPVRDAMTLNESVLRDLDEAIDYVVGPRQWRRVVMMGLCSGAVDALQAAYRRDEVTGTVTIDLLGDFRDWRHHAVHYASRLLRWESWKATLLLRNGAIARLVRTALGRRSPESDWRTDLPLMDGDRRPMTRGEVEQVMATLLERDVQMLCAFSAGLEENYNHRGQFAALFPDLAAAPETTVEFFPHADHTFSDRDQQRALIRLVREWMSTRFAPASAVSAR